MTRIRRSTHARSPQTRRVSFFSLTFASFILTFLLPDVVPAETERQRAEIFGQRFHDRSRMQFAIETLQGIDNKLGKVITQVVAVDELAISVTEGHVTPENAIHEQQRLLGLAKSQLDQASEVLNRFAFPQLYDAKLSAQIRDLEKYLHGLRDHVASFLQDSEGIARATATGSPNLLRRVQGGYHNRVLVLLEGEIVFMKSTLRRTKRTHPEYYLTNCMLALNESFVMVLRSVLKAADTKDSRAVSAAIEVATEMLDGAKHSIFEGEKRTSEIRIKAAAMPERTQFDRRNKTILESVSRSYEEAFTTERRIIYSMNAFLRYLRNDLGTANYSFLDTSLTELQRLFDKRVEHNSHIRRLLIELPLASY